MCLVTHGRNQEVLRQEVQQDVCSLLIGRRRFAFESSCLLWQHTLGILGMGLFGVHEPGQYLIKAGFEFGSNIVVVGLFLPGGINSGRARDNPQIIISLS